MTSLSSPAPAVEPWAPLDGNHDPYQSSIEEIDAFLHSASWEHANEAYDEFSNDPEATPWLFRELCIRDRFFLLTRMCGRVDADHPWLYARCREVEAEPDGCLDLWAREHYKSTIITFAGSLQEILKDPEITIGIFSHSKTIARDFLKQIKTEMENNTDLIELFPDVLWENPKKAPQWSSEGITVKRSTNPREATVEAWGLVDGQPIGKHFALLVYDDVVTDKSVTTPDQIKRTTDSYMLSMSLGRQRAFRAWRIGTRYNYADTYNVMLKGPKTVTEKRLMEKGGSIKPRIYAATDNGLPDGDPVFMTPEAWHEKRFGEQAVSQYILACQYLQNPLAGSEQEFQEEWLRYYEVRPLTLNVYITVDYAGGRASTGSSRTAFVVTGVDSRLNKYLLDGACHRMALTERWRMLKYFWNKWSNRPGIQTVTVGYERYGAQSDIEHFETMMQLDNDVQPFPIEEVNWPRDNTSTDKLNRIRRLEPDFRNWRVFLPYNGPETKLQRKAREDGEEYLIARPIRRRDEEKQPYDLVQYMIDNEYLFFPATSHLDFLDAWNRIYDLDIAAPIIYRENDLVADYVM